MEVTNVCPDAETGMFGAFEELKEGCGWSRQTWQERSVRCGQRGSWAFLKKFGLYHRSHGKLFVSFMVLKTKLFYLLVYLLFWG